MIPHRTVRASKPLRCHACRGAFLILLLALAPSAALADDDTSPEMTVSGDLEDHEARTRDPQTHGAEDRSMEEAESRDPEGLAIASDPEDTAEPSRPAAHEGHSTALQDLGTAPHDDAFEPIDDGRLEGVDEAGLSAEQLLAKRRLERAQSKAEAARIRYGDMMRSDYPRGEARERIVDARDASMAALRDARRKFDAAMGN